VLFILALLTLSFAPRTIAKQWIIFALAHAVGIVLAVRGMADFPSRIGEPFLVVAIAYAAVEGALARRLSSSRLALIGVFGIVYGLESGEAFIALAPRASEPAVATSAFIGGALIGHAVSVAIAFAVGRALAKVRPSAAAPLPSLSGRGSGRHEFL
jgi:hypothetical protein